MKRSKHLSGWSRAAWRWMVVAVLLLWGSGVVLFFWPAQAVMEMTEWQLSLRHTALVLHGVLTMVVFTIVFSKLIKLPSDNVPYPVLVYAALLPWQFFANTLAESSTSLIDNQNLLTKSIGLCLRLRALDFSTQCAIPGFSVCGAVHDPVRAVYLPGRFQQQHRAGTVAHALLPQSHGRSHRRVPLGHYRQNRYNLLAGVLALRSIGGTDLYKWFLVFQKNGKKFC